ncbi:hypothetical protein ACHAXM_009257 [Skeletonema potamos]|jgi:hypothetical protein
MPNKQDTELLEYLRTRKNTHVRRAVQKFHAPTTPTQRRTTNASKSTNTAVKRRIEQLERKIIEQSEKTGNNKSLMLLSQLPPRSHQKITDSPRAVSPKQLYQKSGWDNDDDTTVSTVSISSMSMSSALSVDRPMEIRFELSCLKERPTAELFGSPSSDAIRKIEHICVLDSSCSGSPSISSDTQTLSTSLAFSLSSSSIKVEDPKEGSFNYYFLLSVFLLSAKGVDPVAICTIYLLLEIFRQHV